MSNKHYIPEIYSEDFTYYNPYSILKNNEIVEYITNYITGSFIENGVSKVFYNGTPFFFLSGMNDLYNDATCFMIRQKEAIIMRGYIEHISKMPLRYKEITISLLLTLGYTAFFMSRQKMMGFNSFYRVKDVINIGKGIINAVKKMNIGEITDTMVNEESKEIDKIDSYYPIRTGQSLMVFLYHLHFYGLVSLSKSMDWLRCNNFPFEILDKDVNSKSIDSILDFIVPSEVSVFGTKKLRYIYRDIADYESYFNKEYINVRCVDQCISGIKKLSKNLYWGTTDDGSADYRDKYWKKK